MSFPCYSVLKLVFFIKIGKFVFGELKLCIWKIIDKYGCKIFCIGKISDKVLYFYDCSVDLHISSTTFPQILKVTKFKIKDAGINTLMKL